MSDEVKRGPGRPRRNENEPGVPYLPEQIDERETTEKPTDGRPQQVGYVNEMPNHPDFHDNPLVEITTDHPDYNGVPGPVPKGCIEVEIVRRYVPEVRINDAGNAVSDGDGGHRAQDNAGQGATLAPGRIVRLPKKEAARLIKNGVATTTENSFDAAD